MIALDLLDPYPVASQTPYAVRAGPRMQCVPYPVFAFTVDSQGVRTASLFRVLTSIACDSLMFAQNQIKI